MIVRNSFPASEGSARTMLEREQLTLSNVQIDSWLAEGSPSVSDNAMLAILRSVLSRYVWQRPDLIEFARTPSGRIFLRQDVLGRPLYFSFASSANRVSVILSREARMGLAIASAAEADVLIPKVESEIAAQERDALAGLTATARRRALLAIWTRKRALQQANAVREVTPLRAIAVGMGELALELPASFGWPSDWRLHGFTLRSGEIGSIAVYRHERFLALGAADRRNGTRPHRLPGYERRR